MTNKEINGDPFFDLVDKAAGVTAALEMIKKTMENPELSKEHKIARINYILLLSDGKAGSNP
jgi:hypothetical protein